MTALALQKREDIIERLREGEFVNDIAADLGVSGPAITQNLSKDPEYIAARLEGAEKRMQEDYKGIRNSADALSLARAREGFKASSWFAEREFPDRWGGVRQQSGVALTVVLAQHAAPQDAIPTTVVIESK